MCKKLIYLVSFALVLSLFLPNAVEADLVGWWKFDEGSGTTATDSSGYGNDGTLGGNASWDVGKFGSSLYVDGASGAGWVDIDPASWDPIERQVTVAFWAFGDEALPANCFMFGAWSADDNSAREASAAPWGNGNMYWDTGQVSGNDYDRIFKEIPEEHLKGEWVHWAFTKDCDTGEVYIYTNGELFHSGTGMTKPMMGVIQFSIGVRAMSDHTQGYIGWIDDFRLYDHVLTEEELLAVLEGAGADYPYALGPNPADGVMLEDTWVNLGWRPGSFAVSHDVYLGDNFDDVNDGAEGTFQGNQASANLIIGFPGFPYPGGLVPGTTYYWRIDEVNDTEPNSPWKGKVWSFFIPPRTAYDPIPADGVKFVKPDVELSWTAGFNAKLHYVFFGDNFDDVNNAVVGLPQSETTYTPGTLELEKIYYWRVDEFDGLATHKGDVWSFRTLPKIPITDPTLVGWWTLDEGSGTTAVDWSGHDHHGTLINGPQWEAGYQGGALAFDGRNDYVSVPLDVSETEYAAALWFKTTNGNCGLMAVVDSDLGVGGHDRHIYLTGGNIRIRLWDTEEIETTGLNLANGLWHHVVYTYGATIGGQKVYVDGVLRASGTKNASDFDWQQHVNIGFSNDAANNYFEGVLDDVRIYDKILTQAEVEQTMRGDPLLAWSPNPANGSTVYIRDATPLSWSAGDNASQHDVYFGNDREAVVDADSSDTTGIYRGRQGVTIYTPAEGVEWGGGPYYWRVDEYNTDGTISKGNVWSFTVTDFIEIDDIEDYNDYPPDEIFSTWIDGWEVPTNGSLAGHAEPPFAETGNVHGGRQSMPVYYENNFKYSEITMTLVYPRDWTEEGVGVLSLWFYGDTSNAAELMYVNLNGIATVYHNNPDAALIATWTEWTIDLQEFAAKGVNLANVNTISIGFGDKNNLLAGGTGMVLFDDIRLYRLAP